MDILKKVLLVYILIVTFGQWQIDGFLTVQERWERYGFGYEEHEVTTEDGYILTLMRIPSSPDNTDEGPKPPVYMTHYIYGDSTMMVTNGPDYSPAFSLATRGFDVWLNNFRFTNASRGHVSLDPENDAEYWDFDMIDLRHDLMADIMYILNYTEHDTLSTYGFSFGGAVTAYAMALEPDFFSARINIAALIVSPVSYAHTNSLAITMFANSKPMIDYVRSLGINGVMLEDNPAQDLLVSVWQPLPYLCWGLHQFLVGDNDPSSDHIFGTLNVLPQGMPFTLQLYQHFTQSARTGRVSYFDYGIEGNLENYGTEEAPLIPIEDTTTRVVLLDAMRDEALAYEDVEWYANILGDLVVDWQYYDISHLGFFMGDSEEYLTDLSQIYESYADDD